MRLVKAVTFLVTGLGATALVRERGATHADLPNRIPEAAPYVTDEAAVFPPPYEEYWQTQNHPGQCQTCHEQIFDEWNGSMMSNSWRDPVWRAAFLLLARSVSTHGECDTPEPPDGTARASHNPFARPGECASEFDTGRRKVVVSRPGSLLDGFCSRCHMPTNYVDNVPLHTVTVDPRSGLESAPLDPRFHPTSDNGTGIAFATVDAQLRNTESGKSGIFCAVCHSYAATRDTPFHNYARGGQEYVPAIGRRSRADLLPAALRDIFGVADPDLRNLGYSIGAGSYRLSPHAIAFPERVGPLAAGAAREPVDRNTSEVFGHSVPYQQLDPSKHAGHHQAMFVRSEMCAACHDVTNALPIKNALGRWVGGFPIERTYTEWAGSRYADRPGNTSFDPRHKRDCQSCHMQQDQDQPGTAQTLYDAGGRPLPIASKPVATDGAPRPYFTHHFVGGNALVPGLIGKAVDRSGNVSPYPELSTFSFSSADHASPYSRAVWTNLDGKGAYAQQGRLAWDRLRHVLSLSLTGPDTVRAGDAAPLSIGITNTGSGHNFPTGFPEGRIAWLAVHAYDLATGKELAIHDSAWKRTSIGVGRLTSEEMVDPAYPGCDWHLPPASVDPYAIQFKAVASLGDGCPTLELPYAAPLNLITGENGMPVDSTGRVIDAASNPTGLPQFRDVDGDGDLFDDSFLTDTRLGPLPHARASRQVNRYQVMVPSGTRGPIAVTATVYYQSIEAIVAEKFLGNLADDNGNLTLEPCVLGGLCDGRRPTSEPAVVEGSPPVPMEVRSVTIAVEGAPPDRDPPQFAVYPAPGAPRAHQDTVVKLFFDEPVSGVDAGSFTLVDSDGVAVPARVDRIGDGTWALFPDHVLLAPGIAYTARLAAGICDPAGNCTREETAWSFIVAVRDAGEGDTSIQPGFSAISAARASPAQVRR